MANKNFTVKNGLEVGGQEVISSSGAITSAALGGQTLGTTDSPTFANATLTGSLRGPSTFTIDPAAVGDNTGTLVIAGNLQVDGTTTTINSTTMTVDDLNLTLASGAANAAAANGAGITVDIAGATNPSLVYGSSNDDWTFNKNLNVTGTATMDGLTVEANTATFSAGTSGNMEVVIQADTDNNDEGDSPSLVFKQDGGNTIGRIGLIGNANDVFTGSLANSLYIGNNETANLQLYTDLKERVRISNIGDISFYNTAGTSQALFWDASAESLGIGTTSPDALLDISSATTSTLRLSNSDTALTENQITGQLEFYQADASSQGTGITGKIAMRSVAQKPAGGNYYGNVADMDFYVSGQTNGLASDNATLNAMTIQAASGNVGIGTTSPAYPLHVWSDTTIARLGGTDTNDTYLNIFKDNASSIIKIQASKAGTGATNVAINPDGGNVGIGTSSPDTIMEIVGANPILTIRDTSTSGADSHATLRLAESGASDTLNLHYDISLDEADLTFNYDNTGTNPVEMMRIDGFSGNVGIGTNSPAVKLAVSNNGAEGIELVPSGGGEPIIQSYNRSGAAFTSLRVTASDLKFYAGSSPTEAMRIDSSGNVGIGNSNPSAFNTLNATDKLVIGDSTDSNLTLFGTTYGSLAFADSDTSSSTAQYAGLIQYYHADNSMQFYTASTERMRIDSSGNVGIGTGTDTPGAKLEIKDGDLWLNGATGTSNPEIFFVDDSGVGIAGAKIRYGNQDGNLYFDHKWDNAGSGFFFRNRVDGTALNTMALVNGNVGIGTTSISQPSAGATTLKIKGTDNNKAGSIYLNSANDSVVAYIYPDSTNGLSINTSTSHPIIFRTGGTERVRIDANGVVHAKAGFGTIPITSCSGFTGTAGQSYLILPPGGLEPVWAVYSGDNYKSRGKGYFRWWYGYGNAASAPNTNRVEVDFINKGFKYYEALIEDMSGTTTYSNSAPTWDYAYWSTQQTFNTTGNNTTYATSSGVGNGTVKAMWGNGGGHGLYDTTMSAVCSWGALDGNAAIGSGYDGSCGTYTSESRGAPSTFMYGSNLRLGRPISGSSSFLQPNVAFSYWFNF